MAQKNIGRRITGSKDLFRDGGLEGTNRPTWSLCRLVRSRSLQPWPGPPLRWAARV